MSEQKYYVSLKPVAMYYSQDWSGYNSVNYKKLWLDKTEEFVPECDRDEFTLQELSELMYGALYKIASYPLSASFGQEEYFGWHTVDNHWEWQNQLIELVPVESER